MSAIGDVRHTYDQLADLVTMWETCGPTDHLAAATAAPLLHFEARLLDDGRTGDWLDRWAADGVLWVPLDAHAHPAADQSFYLDDLRRLRERVTWARTPSAWSQHPPLRTTRLVGNIEAVARADGVLDVRSSLLLWEQRGTSRHPWVGHQLHRWGSPAADGSRLLEAKILCLPAMRGAVPHPGALL